MCGAWNIMLRSLILLLFFCAHLKWNAAKVILESTSPLLDENILTGFHLKSFTLIKISNQPGFSFCGRFNFRRIIKFKTRLIRIQTNDWRLFFFNVSPGNSFAAFGNIDKYGSSPSWVMAEKTSRGINFDMWSIQRWHAVCFSYSTRFSHVTITKVGT